MSDFWGEFEVIHTYTREQAIKDGVLVDVTKTAEEAGFRVPVALTATVWHEYIEPREGDRKRWGQDQNGRLWDVLSALGSVAARHPNASILLFQVLFVINGRRKNVSLKAVIGPGDKGEPVITIMLPSED